MENWTIHFHQPKPINKVINSATIVVDANVLLSAYQWRNVTVEEVLKVLENLSRQNRLKIPHQVVFEFNKNRPGKLKERINEIETTLSSLKKESTPLNERVPMLEGQDVFKKTDELLEKYNEAQKAYKNGLIEIRESIKELFIKDPYLDRLKEILVNSYFQPDLVKNNLDEIIQEAQERFKKKIPPGYKDDPKEENNSGDYVIWKSILQIKNDVIFISNDKKPDWVYKDNHGNPISPRRELVEEFYKETDGKDFFHLSPKEFISLYNPDLSKDVKDDLDSPIKNKIGSIIKLSFSDIIKNNLAGKVNSILVEYDPFGVVIDEKNQSNEYISEAKEIVSAYGLYENEDDFDKEVIRILEASFEETMHMNFSDLANMLNKIKNTMSIFYTPLKR